LGGMIAHLLLLDLAFSRDVDGWLGKNRLCIPRAVNDADKLEPIHRFSVLQVSVAA
jgi:hypothetical protein